MSEKQKYRDYAKVVKVLESCKDVEQVKVAENMMQNYTNMYGNDDPNCNLFDFHFLFRRKVRALRQEEAEWQAESEL